MFCFSSTSISNDGVFNKGGISAMLEVRVHTMESSQSFLAGTDRPPSHAGNQGGSNSRDLDGRGGLRVEAKYFVCYYYILPRMPRIGNCIALHP